MSELVRTLRASIPETPRDRTEMLIDMAADEIELLTQELAERDEQHRSVISSPCPDEQHCTCVPILRRENQRLKERLRMVRQTALNLLHDTTQPLEVSDE